MNKSIPKSEQEMNEHIIVAPKVYWSPSSLAHAFPNSSSHARRKINELRREIFVLQDKERFSAPRNLDVEFYVNFVNIDADIHAKIVHMNFLKKYLTLLKNAKSHENKINVEKAKTVPISNWVDFNHAGFAQCFLHQDKTPSMKYYEKENRVYCFSCGFSGDVIDIVRKIKNCSFCEAVNILS
jgi:hypothetical protein